MDATASTPSAGNAFRIRSTIAAALLVVTGLFTTGCMGLTSGSAAGNGTSASTHDPEIAQVSAASIAVYDTAGGTVQRHIGDHDALGSPQVLLVRQEQGTWVQVDLPTRPNGSTGWVRRQDVELSSEPYHLSVDLSAHRLTLYKGRIAVLHTPVAVGKAGTETPTGQFYVTDLLRPPNAAGAYGPYAFGLSAHSPVLTSFAGGDGQIGLHGTNEPDLLGTDASHGCVRLSNAVVVRLAELLPLGTPVDIVA